MEAQLQLSSVQPPVQFDGSQVAPVNPLLAKLSVHLAIVAPLTAEHKNLQSFMFALAGAYRCMVMLPEKSPSIGAMLAVATAVDRSVKLEPGFENVPVLIESTPAKVAFCVKLARSEERRVGKE